MDNTAIFNLFYCIALCEYIQKDLIAIVILEGHCCFFIKKRKWWAFGVVLYCFSFGEHILHCLLSISIFGTILVLLGGCFCCINLPKTGWELCYSRLFCVFPFGIFGLTAYLPFLKKIFVYCCYCVWQWCGILLVILKKTKSDM